MNTEKQILLILEQNKNQSISGENLAAKLNITRAAVWKAIKELKKQGHEITAQKRKGYTLLKNSDILSVQGVSPYLKYDISQIDIVVEDSVTSTNILAKELAEKGSLHGSIVLANSQSMGRGRLSRKFSSPKGTGVYLSIILRKNLTMQNTALITCAAAVATLRAICQFGAGQGVQIKWVNDLYKNNKKCCGILCEAAFDIQTGDIDYIVAGIGVNLKEPKEGFDETIKNIATSVFDDNTYVARGEFAACVASELIKICDEMPNNNFMDEYKQHNLVPGKEIIVLQNGNEEKATALSITSEGHLQVKLENNTIKTLTFGEVSVILDSSAK